VIFEDLFGLLSLFFGAGIASGTPFCGGRSPAVFHHTAHVIALTELISWGKSTPNWISGARDRPGYGPDDPYHDIKETSTQQALALNPRLSALVHQSDYKLDETPTGGCTTNHNRLHELTPNGVLVMLGDSTNADRPGRTPTEQLVADALDEIFTKAAGDRIIIATFSSLLARLQEIMRLAEKYGRKVALTGHSL
jgi:ribonuclease J